MTLDHNRHLVAYPGIKKNKPGKIGYMSPELFAGNSFYGHLSDVWAMGQTNHKHSSEQNETATQVEKVACY